MNKRALQIAVVAFLVGVAGFEVYARDFERKVSGGGMTEVLVLQRDLNPGEKLTEAALSTLDVPLRCDDGRRVPRSDRARVAGRPVTTALKAGQGLVWTDVGAGGEAERLAETVTAGKRAYTVSGRDGALGAELQPGDRVDVLLGGSGGGEVLVERVKVLRAGGGEGKPGAASKSRGSGGSGITLEVSPFEAKVLVAAEGRGPLRLVLRHPDDLGAPTPGSESRKQAPATSKTSAERVPERVR